MKLEKAMEEFNKKRDLKLQELEERRNKNLESFRTDFRMDILETVEESIRKNIQHIKSSPETLAKIHQLEETNAKQNEKMDLMACQVAAMYEVFTSTNFILRTTVKVFGAIGVVTGSIIGVIELFKRTK